MTYSSSVRLRDIPKLSRDGLIMLAGAVLTFAMAGFMLTTIPAESHARTLARAVELASFLGVGLVSTWGVDRELREVGE